MFRRAMSFLRKRQVERDLDDELRASLELLAEEHIGHGVSPAEALRLARIELGGVEQVKEQVRGVRGLPMLDSALRDGRYALRNLVRSPGFSIAVVATLGLALGANAAVLSLLDRLILRPLPVKEPGSLVAVHAPRLPERPSAGGRAIVVMRSASGTGLSYPLYAALGSRVPAFTGMLAQTHALATMLVDGTPVGVEGRLVTGNYFELLGVKAAVGRLLTPDDDERPDGSPVVLSHGLWQRQFGGAPAILNRTIHLNRYPVTVVGVAAQAFTGTAAGQAPEFFAPLRLGGVLSGMPSPVTANFRFDSPDLHMYGVMARLAPGMDLKEAERAADQVYQQLVAEALGPGPGESRARRDYARRRSEFRLQLSPGGYASSEQSSLSHDLRTPLLLLMAMVGLVLAIAAGNVANLFLARGEARSREVAIRFALGAGRWRVLRALLVESLLLTLTAGALGLLLARWTTSLAPVVLNVERMPDGVTPAPDLRIGAAVVLLSLAAGFCIWAASAPRAVGRATLAGLATQVQAGGRTMRWRRALVVAQVALSIVLLCGSAVLSRSLIRLMSVDPGFSVDHLYSFWLNPGRSGYDPGRSSAILAQVFEALGGIPGVKGVSIATDLPLSGRGVGTGVNRDQNPGENRGESVDTDIGRASAGHLANLGIAMVAGREFSRDDLRGAKVAVINEALAHRLFGKSDPIGRGIGMDGGRPEWRVVGVVKDVRPGPRVPAKLILYQPYNVQDPVSSAGFALRVEKGVRLTSEMVRAAVRRVETGVAVEEFAGMAEQAAQSLNRDRMMAWVSMSFAILAALLCAIGIFGLTSYSVTKRAQEIGIRITLGATRASIQWMVMREVSAMAAIGCGLGLAAFLFAGRVLSTMLFGLTPSDPASLAAGAAVLGGTAFLAGFLPAWRATLVDPARTLRQE